MNVRLRVLRDQLRQILYWRWDPIGVSDAFPHTIDECDSYIWPLLRLLSGGADAAAINQHLRLLERDTSVPGPATRDASRPPS